VPSTPGSEVNPQVRRVTQSQTTINNSNVRQASASSTTTGFRKRIDRVPGTYTLKRTGGPGHGYGQLLVRRCNKGFDVIADYLPGNVEKLGRWLSYTPLEYKAFPFIPVYRSFDSRTPDEVQVMEISVNTIDGVKFRLLTLDAQPASNWRDYAGVKSDVHSVDAGVRTRIRNFTSVKLYPVGKSVVNSAEAAQFFAPKPVAPAVVGPAPVAVAPIAPIPSKPWISAKPDYVWPLPQRPKTVPTLVSRHPLKKPATPHKFKTPVYQWSELYRMILKNWKRVAPSVQPAQRSAAETASAIARNGQRNARYA
jgi:hypothetical protein